MIADPRGREARHDLASTLIAPPIQNEETTLRASALFEQLLKEQPGDPKFAANWPGSIRISVFSTRNILSIRWNC